MSRTPFDDQFDPEGRNSAGDNDDLDLGEEQGGEQDENELDADDPSDVEDEFAAAADLDEAGAAAAAQSQSAEIAKLRKERDDLFERLARATADYRNSQRRLQADKEQAVQYANSQLIKTLLPVIDNFERALQVDPKKADAASILKGMQIVHDQWINVLRQQNVELISPEPGTPFDPTQHEAVMQQATDKYKEPTVTQLFARGYSLHGRTLRPAQVAVSKTG